MNKWIKCFKDIKKGFKRIWKDYKNGTLSIFSLYPNGAILNENFIPIYIPKYEIVFDTSNRKKAKDLILNYEYLKEIKIKNDGIDLGDIYIYIPNNDTKVIPLHMVNTIMAIWLENKSYYLDKETTEKILNLFNSNINKKFINNTENNIVDLLTEIANECNKNTKIYKFFVCDNTKSKLYKKEYPNQLIIELMVDMNMETNKQLEV